MMIKSSGFLIVIYLHQLAGVFVSAFFFPIFDWHIFRRDNSQNKVFTLNLYWSTDFGLGGVLKVSHTSPINGGTASDMAEWTERSTQQKGNYCSCIKMLIKIICAATELFVDAFGYIYLSYNCLHSIQWSSSLNI